MGGSSSKVTQQDEAILSLKLQRDSLHRYQAKLSTLTDVETRVARQLLVEKGDKPRALLALRRKKYKESLLAKTDAQLEQLEKLVANVEFALIQKDVMFGLEQGSRVLKEIHAEMGGIERVERLLEEGEEARCIQEEMTNVLAKQNIDAEDEVEEELAALEAEYRTQDAVSKRLPDRVQQTVLKHPIAQQQAQQSQKDQAAPVEVNGGMGVQKEEEGGQGKRREERQAIPA